MKLIFLHIKRNFRWYFLFLLFVSAVVLWSAAAAENQTGLIFAVLNIGQGDGLLTTVTQYMSSSPSGCHWLIWQV